MFLPDRKLIFNPETENLQLAEYECFVQKLSNKT